MFNVALACVCLACRPVEIDGFAICLNSPLHLISVNLRYVDSIFQFVGKGYTIRVPTILRKPVMSPLEGYSGVRSTPAPRMFGGNYLSQ